jgi:shikimate dehydrogenase
MARQSNESLASVPSASLIEKCCLIACPVAGNPTHYMVEQALAQQGLDWRFMTFEVEPARLGDAMRGIRALGFHGVKIGEPFQEVVLEHLDSLSERATQCGSVNCVTADGDCLVGDNTEGAALVELLRGQVNLVGLRVTILGAGRLARAIALALAAAGAAQIAIASRSAERGERIAELLQQHTSTSASLLDVSKAAITHDPETAVLVNATSQSTLDPAAKLPIDPASLRPKLIVADVTYNAAHTWLTRQAAQRGCCTIDGLAIYVQQTALALKGWTGVLPDTVSMREAAEEFLGI